MITKLRVFDFIAGAILVIAGAYFSVSNERHFNQLAVLLVLSGFVNLFFAWLSPAKMFHALLRKRLVRPTRQLEDRQ